jgi:hypothetical protein
MSEPKSVALIHPQGGRAAAPALPGLAEALRAQGASVEEYRLPRDVEGMLDALGRGVLPVVLKA